MSPERYWVHSDPTITRAPTVCIGSHLEPTTARAGMLCTNCRNRLSSLLVQIPSLAIWLHENIAPTGSAGQRITGTKEHPIPLRIDILDYIGPTATRELSETMGTTRRELNAAGKPERVQIGDPSLLDVISRWALQVSEEHNDDWPPNDDLATLCRWLHHQLDWIIAQPWVDDLLTNLIDIAWKAERLAPRDPEMRRINQPCPTCNLLALVFTRGIGVKCETRMGGCGRSWVDDDFDRLLIVLGATALEETA